MAEEELPQLEEIEEVETSNVDGVEAPLEAEEPQNIPKKTSRAEKKARKAIVRMGLQKIDNINRVTLRKNQNVLFVIADPEVYKSNGGTYVVFGEAEIQDFEKSLAPKAPVSNIKEPIASKDEFTDQDIEMVMQQSGADRELALKTLQAEGDVVGAILKLQEAS